MGLIHPGILAGLLAVALPVIIHFIRSRRYERVEIGTVRFLRVALRQKRRWRRIENWPLLLARIAAVTLLTCLFARPFLPDREKINPGELEALLLVDVSGSVSGAHFEKVRNAVRETVAKIPVGAKVTIAAFADSVRPLADATVESLKPIAGAPTDYGRAVNWALDHLAQSDRKSAHVYLIGDLQRVSLPSSPPRLWPANTHATVVAVPPPGTWNAAISKVELLTPYAKEEAKIEVTVSIFGDAPSAKRKVILALDGQPAQEQMAEPGGGPLLFRWNPQDSVIVRGKVSIVSDDAFPQDNERPIAARLMKPRRIALIEGGRPVTPYEGESYFLEKALSVSGRANGQSPYTTHVQWSLPELREFDAVGFCNTAFPSDEEAKRLAEFVQSGGAVAFFLGSNTERGGSGAQMPVARSGLLPEKISRVATALPHPIETWDQTHATLARFDGEERGDLRTVVLRDAFEIEASADWKVLARLDNGHPTLLGREMGKGRVLVFSNPLTRAWGDFPRTRLFLPLMQEWFGWLTRLDPKEEAATEIAPGLLESRVPGVYEVGERLEVVAPDPQEMDVAVADAATTRRALGLPAERSAAPLQSSPGLPQFRERQNELWPWVALLLLALLAWENHLADRRRPASV